MLGPEVLPFGGSLAKLTPIELLIALPESILEHLCYSDAWHKEFFKILNGCWLESCILVTGEI